jgi:hypothetical protein
LRSKQRASLPVLASQKNPVHTESIFRIEAGIEERIQESGFRGVAQVPP